ncbi:ASCH domain-containing protein [Bacillota bacterium LX-D]|nr:ASCH domain-containing protein [Bacillota bacterium LX-D]
MFNLATAWASLIALGLKHIETRNWSTKYQGDLYIHAGKTLVPFDYLRTKLTREDQSAVLEVLSCKYGEYNKIPTGFIITKTYLSDCLPIRQKFADYAIVGDDLQSKYQKISGLEFQLDTIAWEETRGYLKILRKLKLYRLKEN